MKELSIIIVSYNNKDVIAECLNSISQYNDIGDKLQTIVVEQSESDEIYKWIATNFPWVELVRAENKGFGAGNNRGAAIATADTLLFLNPDTILTEPIASFAIERFRSNAKLGLYGVKLVKRDGSFCSSFQMLVPYGIVNKLIYKICAKRDIFLKRHMYIEGADIFMRHQLFDEIGQFDENLFMYCEEPDLCIRTRRAGYEIGYFPDKKIIHLQGACSNGRLESVMGRQLESFKYLCNKHGMNFKRIIGRDICSHKLIKLLMTIHGASKHLEGIEYRNILINIEKAFIK